VKKKLDDNERRLRHDVLNYDMINFVPSPLLKSQFLILTDEILI